MINPSKHYKTGDRAILAIDGMANFTAGLAYFAAGFKGDQETIDLLNNSPKNIPEGIGWIIDKALPYEGHYARNIGSAADLIFSFTATPLINDVPLWQVFKGTNILNVSLSGISVGVLSLPDKNEDKSNEDVDTNDKENH